MITNKRLIIRNFAILLFSIIIFNSCRKEPIPDPIPINNEEQAMVFSEGQMELGEKLENPYSVENMSKALENNESLSKSTIKIEPTHFYVRFRPKSEQELEMLKRDATLDLYDYPLDVEIKKGGTHYHDPSIPANEITWQYTVVPFNYTFPKIQYQKLADLYLPFNDGEEGLKSNEIKYSEWLELEAEALRMTNNLPETEPSFKASSWRPSGTILVKDDILNSTTTHTVAIFDHWEYYECDGIVPLEAPNPSSNLKSTPEAALIELIEPGELCQRPVYRYETTTTTSDYIPVEGVLVRATRWFTTHKGYTDSNGNYTCDGTFIYDATYSIKWEAYDYDIRDGSYGQAYFNGPKQTGSWNLDINQTDYSKTYLFAHIQRAADTYYYKNNTWGILPPPTRDGVFAFLLQRLHIAGKDETGRSKYIDLYELFQAATVIVYSSQESTNGTIHYYDSREMFGTTIHELAHASHWGNKGYTTSNYILDWTFGDPRLPESWAVGVEWKITNDIYRDAYNSGNIYSNFYQNYTITQISEESEGYTPLVIDLIDDHNQQEYFNNTNYPNDEVYGYTLSQIESALPGPLESWWVWRDNIIRDYENPTENKVDYLFQTYK